jgi:hypothetical protein
MSKYNVLRQRGRRTQHRQQNSKFDTAMNGTNTLPNAYFIKILYESNGNMCTKGFNVAKVRIFSCWTSSYGNSLHRIIAYINVSY